MNLLLKQDRERYISKRDIPLFQVYLRRVRRSKGILWLIYKVIYRILCKLNHIEIYEKTLIGGGAYFGHAYCITINPKVVIGSNCNIHKGVTIGQENRGTRKGTPSIGNEVWIGVNSTIVGRITIGDDVLIAPNTYVNCDVPLHSVVFGNPCIIKHKDNATEGYINRKSKLI